MLLLRIGWWFQILKIIELADTIFFVLRKNSHTSQCFTLYTIHLLRGECGSVSSSVAVDITLSFLSSIVQFI